MSQAEAKTFAGPTNVHPRILAAQAQPMLGYFQPAFHDIMDEIQEGLRCALTPSAGSAHKRQVSSLRSRVLQNLLEGSTFILAR